MTYALSGLDPALAQINDKNNFFKMGFPENNDDNSSIKGMTEEEQ